MKRFTILAALGAVLISSCGATLTVRLTPPATDQIRGTCSAPVDSTGTTEALDVIVWIPARGLRDSLPSQPRGIQLARSYTVPEGDYEVSAWCIKRTVAGAFTGCAITRTLSTGRTPPAKPAIR